ncbi:MAG: MFS transporter [Burkholderiaceae bacterium]|jgi:predicted MFS family arabinose efflux permease|nr:MFS transporter [Burkholderiaceae bacterium]
MALLCLAYFIVIANITLVIPIFPLMQAELDLGPAQSQILLGAFPTIALVANLLLGPLIDRHGRKPFLVLGALGSGLAFLTMAWVSEPVTVLVARAVTGVFIPMMGASIFASVADLFPTEQRARYTGYVAATAPVAQLLAIPLTLLAGNWLSWRSPIAGCALLCAVVLLMALRLPSRTPPRPSGTQDTGTWALVISPSAGGLLAAYFLFSAASFCFLALYPAWLHFQMEDWGTSSAELYAIFVAGGLAGFAGALVAPRWGRQFRHATTLCAVVAVLGALALAAVPASARFFVPQLLAYCAFSFCRAAMLPIVMSSGMSLARQNQRSTMNGLLNAVFQSGAALGSFASVALYARSPSYTGVCAAAAMACVAGAAAFTWSNRSTRLPAPQP